MQRNFAAGNKTIDRALELNPNEIGLWEIKIKLAIAEKGDFSVYEQAWKKMKAFRMSNEERLQFLRLEADLLLLQRKYQQVLQLYESAPDDSLAAVPFLLGAKYFTIGIAKNNLRDYAAARAAFVRAKDIFEEQLKQKPDDPGLHIQLAKLLAWLGEKDAAIAEAQRATDLRPESKDAFDGARVTVDVAQVYAIIGDNARAIELLDGLLSRLSGVTVQNLRVDPAWDPLRADPAFQKLCEEKQP